MNRLRLLPLALSPLAFSVFAATATVATAPSATTSPASAGNLLQVLMGLVAVLALMAGAAWLLRRFNASKGMTGASIKIIGGVSVGSRERVVVVEVADQWIVVGVAPGQVTALSTMPKQETVPSEAAPSKNFSSWLAQTIEKRNGK